MTLAVLLLASAPAAAADGCDQLCQMADTECRRDCKGEQACLTNCADTRSQCPELCRAMVKAKGNREQMSREANRILDEAEKSKKAPGSGKKVQR